jgi:hypothetical protein
MNVTNSQLLAATQNSRAGVILFEIAKLSNTYSMPSHAAVDVSTLAPQHHATLF